MCVIVYKPRYKDLPEKSILRTCYYNNNDGVGYTFTYKNEVIIKKGYQDFNKFYKHLLKDYKKYNLNKHNLIIHFRIGTSGGLTKEKTQPFKITSNVKELNKLYIKNKKTSIVHNGVLSDYTYDDTLSDTQNYIKDFLSPLLKSKIKDKNGLIKDTLFTSKIAMLNCNDRVSLYGEYINDKGIYYSNASYNNWSYKDDIKKYEFTCNDKKEINTPKYKYYGYDYDYYDKEYYSSKEDIKQDIKDTQEEELIKQACKQYADEYGDYYDYV